MGRLGGDVVDSVVIQMRWAVWGPVRPIRPGMRLAGEAVHFHSAHAARSNADQHTKYRIEENWARYPWCVLLCS